MKFWVLEDNEVNTNIFKDFSKEIMNEGATILGGCCNVTRFSKLY